MKSFYSKDCCIANQQNAAMIYGLHMNINQMIALYYKLCSTEADNQKCLYAIWLHGYLKMWILLMVRETSTESMQYFFFFLYKNYFQICQHQKFKTCFHDTVLINPHWLFENNICSRVFEDVR